MSSAAASASLAQSNRIDGYIHTEGTTIYDQAGHQVRFFGIDSRTFGYGPSTAACPTINWTAISPTEIANEEQWGFNVVRIAVSWADLEPTPPTSNGLVHNWNMTYLDALATAVQEYNQAGIAVILDMHQTFWSPAFTQANSKSVTGGCQGTGFPIWMYPDAASISVNQAICDFYNNVPEPGVIQKPADGLLAVEQFLAGYFASGSEGQVIGFDMLNEPNPVVGTTCQNHVGADMLAIYQNIGGAIRSVDPSAALIYEDYSFESYELQGLMLSSPLNMPNAILESHAYPATWNEAVPSTCTGSKAHPGLPFYTAHLQQAQGFDQPLWVGEFNGFDTNNSCVDSNWQSDLTSNMQYDTTNDVNWSFWDYIDLNKNIGILPYLQAAMNASTPALAITAPAPGSTVGGTVTVSGTVGDADAVTSVEVAIGSEPAVSTPVTGGNWTAQLPTAALANASQTITASATDSAGNTGTASESVTVDNALPPTVAISTPASGSAVSGTFTASGTVSGSNPISSVDVSIGSEPAVAATVGSGSWTAQLQTTALDNGYQTLEAVATDSTGSTGSTSETVDVTDPPALAITTPAPGGTVEGTVNVAGTVSDASTVASVQVSIGTEPAVTAPVTAGSWAAELSTSGLANTLQTITVGATDAAGTSGTVSESVTVDNSSPPTVGITTPSPGATVSGTFAVTGTVSGSYPISSVEVSIGAESADASVTAGNWTAELSTAGLANTTESLVATATDTAGNTGTTSETVTVNNPTITITSPAPGASVQGTVAVTGTVSDADSVTSMQVSLGGGAAESAPVTNGDWTAQLPTAGLANGPVTIAVSATDSGGNTLSTTESVTLTNPPPAVTITAPAAGATVKGTVSVAGTATDADNAISSVEVSIGNGTTVAATGTTNWSALLPTTSLSNGPQTITVKATDAAGNTQTASEPVTLSNPTPTSCPATPAGMSQLSGNLSVETSQSGWTGLYNTTSVVSRVEPAGGSYGGSWALHIAPKSGASGTAGVNNAGPAWVPGPPGTATSAGATYDGSAFVKGSVAGEKVTLKVVETTSTGSSVGEHATTTTLSDTGWHQISASYKALHTGDLLKYRLFASNFANSGQYLLADCLSLLTNAPSAGGAHLTGARGLPMPPARREPLA